MENRLPRRGWMHAARIGTTIDSEVEKEKNRTALVKVAVKARFDFIDKLHECGVPASYRNVRRLVPSEYGKEGRVYLAVEVGGVCFYREEKDDATVYVAGLRNTKEGGVTLMYGYVGQYASQRYQILYGIEKDFEEYADMNPILLPLRDLHRYLWG